METSKYRKISELEKLNPYVFAVCLRCKEVFVNDTLEPDIYCPVHKELMCNYTTEERALLSLRPECRILSDRN